MQREKRVAILQPNYIPWKGYFDIINCVDEFILLEDVQFTRRDWRNRNLIKTSNGLLWLSIPMKVKGKYNQMIWETMVDGHKWRKKHWNSILLNYTKAPFFEDYHSPFKDLYLHSTETHLSKINMELIRIICDLLGIKTKISSSLEYGADGEKTNRLIQLCKSANGTHYISGPAAKTYLKHTAFEKEGVQVSYANYDNYKEYKQLFPPFNHKVSILDLIFNTGPDSTSYLKSMSSKNNLLENKVIEVLDD